MQEKLRKRQSLTVESTSAVMSAGAFGRLVRTVMVSDEELRDFFRCENLNGTLIKYFINLCLYLNLQILQVYNRPRFYRVLLFLPCVCVC